MWRDLTTPLACVAAIACGGTERSGAIEAGQEGGAPRTSPAPRAPQASWVEGFPRPLLAAACTAAWPSLAAHADSIDQLGIVLRGREFHVSAPRTNLLVPVTCDLDADASTPSCGRRTFGMMFFELCNPHMTPEQLARCGPPDDLVSCSLFTETSAPQ